MLARGASSAGGVEQQHIYIKPTRPDLDTTLAINTDQRSYILELHSYEDAWMAAVAWRYPQEEIAQLETTLEQQQQLAQATTAPNISIDKLNFNYGLAVMSGRPQWQPLQVFDDGHKTYIRFPASMLDREAPRPLCRRRGRHAARQLQGQERHVHRRPPVRHSRAAPRSAGPGDRPHRSHPLARKEINTMDDTTRRDVIPPNFDTGAWQQPAATVDAPTRPSAGVFIHERPTTPTPVDSLVDPLARPTGAIHVETASRAASVPRPSADRPTGAQPPPFVERPTSMTTSRAAPADAGHDATGMTYASKIPADRPGLQLEKPRPARCARARCSPASRSSAAPSASPSLSR